jgi:hypothetical protein
MLLQLFNIWFSFINRHLEEKERGLEDALNHIQILERNISNKEAEVKLLYSPFWYILTND